MTKRSRPSKDKAIFFSQQHQHRTICNRSVPCPSENSIGERRRQLASAGIRMRVVFPRRMVSHQGSPLGVPIVEFLNATVRLSGGPRCAPPLLGPIDRADSGRSMRFRFRRRNESRRNGRSFGRRNPCDPNQDRGDKGSLSRSQHGMDPPSTRPGGSAPAPSWQGDCHCPREGVPPTP